MITIHEESEFQYRVRDILISCMAAWNSYLYV